MDNPKLYPGLSIDRIQNPNRLYAIPVLGFIAKLILLIPIFIAVIGLEIAAFCLMIANSFIVLFIGRYWETAYQVFVQLMNVITEVTFYITGLTDSYPGFNLSSNSPFRLSVSKNNQPNRLFAIPVIGYLVRLILLIPFLIFLQIVSYGYYLGAAFGASFSVLFTGRYPESVYELVRDGLRLNLATMIYFFGLSDHYPSFSISMNHKGIKIFLLILGALFFIYSIINSFNQPRNYHQYQYNQSSSTSPSYTY